MPNPTLREIVETFTEEELSLTVPIEFQDVSADDYPYVNEYNRLLASAQINADTDEGYDAFVAANEYRTANQEHIDKYVLDAKKLNIIMTLVINAYMFTKGEKSATNTSYDNSMSGASSTNVQDALDECFQSVSDGKALVASAITDKRVSTDATATFAKMAENIAKIVLGSGNATAGDVLSGKTFTNNDGVEYVGSMTNNAGTSKSAAGSLDSTNSRVQLTIPANAYYSTASKLYIAYSTLASLIGLTAAKIVKGNTILGVAGTAVKAPTSLSGTVSVGKKTWGQKVNGTVTFSTAFASAPTVQITASGGSHGINGVDYVKTTSVTKAGFNWELEVAGTPDAGYTTLTLTWNAVV